MDPTIQPTQPMQTDTTTPDYSQSQLTPPAPPQSTMTGGLPTAPQTVPKSRIAAHIIAGALAGLQGFAQGIAKQSGPTLGQQMYQRSQDAQKMQMEQQKQGLEAKRFSLEEDEAHARIAQANANRMVAEHQLQMAGVEEGDKDLARRSEGLIAGRPILNANVDEDTLKTLLEKDRTLPFTVAYEPSGRDSKGNTLYTLYAPGGDTEVTQEQADQAAKDPSNPPLKVGQKIADGHVLDVMTSRGRAAEAKKLALDKTKAQVESLALGPSYKKLPLAIQEQVGPPPMSKDYKDGEDDPAYLRDAQAYGAKLEAAQKEFKNSGTVPKSAMEAGARAVDALQTYRGNPTPENKKKLDDAVEMQTTLEKEQLKITRPSFPRIEKVTDAQGNTVGYQYFQGMPGGAAPQVSFVPATAGGAPTVEGVIPAQPTGTTKTMAQMATATLPQLASLKTEVDNLADKIGPFAGRYYDAVVNRFGADSPEVAKLDNDLFLAASAVSRTHFGGRAAEKYTAALEQRFRMAQSPEDLKARIDSGSDWLQGYAKMGTAPPNAPANGVGGGGTPGGFWSKIPGARPQ